MPQSNEGALRCIINDKIESDCIELHNFVPTGFDAGFDAGFWSNSKSKKWVTIEYFGSIFLPFYIGVNSNHYEGRSHVREKEYTSAT